MPHLHAEARLDDDLRRAPAGARRTGTGCRSPGHEAGGSRPGPPGAATGAPAAPTSPGRAEKTFSEPPGRRRRLQPQPPGQVVGRAASHQRVEARLRIPPFGRHCCRVPEFDVEGMACVPISAPCQVVERPYYTGPADLMQMTRPADRRGAGGRAVLCGVPVGTSPRGRADGTERRARGTGPAGRRTTGRTAPDRTGSGDAGERGDGRPIGDWAACRGTGCLRHDAKKTIMCG